MAVAAKVLKLSCAIAIVPICTLLVFAFRPATEPAPQADEAYETHLYITWDRFEVDRCVAAWLIKRFVDSKAEFELLPVGSPIPPEGCIAFDTPGARYERVAGKSVSAVVLAETGVQEPAIDKLVRLVQTTEVAFWMLKPGSEEAKLRNSLQALWMGTSEPKRRFELIFDHLDNVVKCG